MSLNQKLDTVLSSLNNDSNKRESFKQVQQRAGVNFNIKELDLILSKLDKDGYIEKIQLKNGNDLINDYTYNITIDGILFLEKYTFFKNSPYRGESFYEKMQKTWLITKTIANVIYCIALVLIGIWSVKLQKENNEKDLEIKKLKKVIEISEMK